MMERRFCAIIRLLVETYPVLLCQCVSHNCEVEKLELEGKLRANNGMSRFIEELKKCYTYITSDKHFFKAH
jgi:hypothetical protein